LDRSLYVTLEGVEAIHIDWKQGAPPLKGQATPAARIKKEEIEIGQITAFFLRTRVRVQTLALQREINNFSEEPLMAVIPGVALSELWNGISYGEQVLKLVALFVVIVGLLGMFMALYTSLNERRREIAILRAVGMGSLKIMCLVVAESGLLSLAGSLLGIGLVYGLVILLQPLVEQQFGLYLPIKPLSATEQGYIAAVVCCGVAIGLIPALRAYRNSLADGLSVRL
jgi:putative ABC transport system permease protein